MTSPSLARPAAFALTAAIALIPANVLPVMSVKGGGYDRTDTIFSGMRALFEEGLWVIGAIVFIASILVPVLKLVGLARLLIAARYGVRGQSRELTRLYSNLSLIGRWSMLDVFLVAFLSGAVQFGAIAHIEPQPGIVAFAAAVCFTMLATFSFDPRLLWKESLPPGEDRSHKGPTS